MRFPANTGIWSVSLRVWLVALLAGAGLAGAAPAAQAFGVESFFAANCKVATCNNEAATPAEEKEKAEAEGYAQAAGHPPFGVTDFKLKRVETGPKLFFPEGSLQKLRIDVAPGVSTNPQAVAKCSVKEFTSTLVNSEKQLYLEPNCPKGSIIGENKITTVLEVAAGVFADVPLTGTVYNLEQLEGPEGLSSYFGVAIPVGAGVYVHTFIEGGVEWASDYHDYFVIKNITPGLLESRLIFKGNIGTGGFVTNPSSCSGPGPQTTTGWTGESYEGATASSSYTTPIGTEGCNSLVPFAPTFSLTPETTQFDQPDGVTTELTLPHDPNPENLDSSQLKTASVTLPEGMTLNPSAAHGLEACTRTQIGIGTRNPVACPAGSKIGTVTLDVPGLPAGSLQGNLYLGGPESGPITEPPYTMYIDAESSRYGISVRLKGSVVPNPTTGRVTASFTENPEQPFSNLILHFNGGALAPLANPLACGTATTETSFTPFTGTAAASPFSQFVVDSNGAGGACASPLPFAPTQTVAPQNPAQAGAYSPFTFKLERPSGQQYLSQVKTTLPAGLVGVIPSVTLCNEPQAQLGECPFASQIGVATATAGAGPAPYTFAGPVYLTGPYNGAPYGMSIVIQAVAGPFNLGPVVTRATINVEPYTGRVVVTSTLPTIVKGIPLRLQSIGIAINRQNFLLNPTNCGALATESTVTGFTPGSAALATSSLSSPFQVSGCNTLAFKPSLTASTTARHTKANGASLEVKVTQRSQPGQHQAGDDDAAQAAALAPDHPPESLPGGYFRSGRPTGRVSVELAGRGRDGDHSGAAGHAQRAGLPGLARRRGVPRPRPDPQGRRGRRDPGRPHPRVERGHHHVELRIAAGRAGLELLAEPADRPELGARRQREPLHREAHDADHDHSRRAGPRSPRTRGSRSSTARCGSSATGPRGRPRSSPCRPPKQVASAVAGRT